jgi:2-polyprenyl-6-methoxyphenol hydroxylase-like FAD-dependent oxidoreductase
MLDELKNAALPGTYTGHFAGISIDPSKVDTSRWTLRLPSPANSSLPVSIGAIETFLAQRAIQLGVEIRRNAEITSFEEHADGVVVHAAHDTMKAQWLVGCDGGRSTIRKLAGFEFIGTEPEGTGYIALVELQDPEKIRMGRNLTPQGIYTQNKPGHISVMEFDHGAFDRDQEIPLEHLQTVLRRVSGTDVTIKTLHVATTFTDRAMQATSYRKGRVLLCGDAAHIHSPLGGQGLNCGIGDAMNLGWKLAWEIKGSAPKDLLDTYNTERHPVGEWVVNWSRAQAAVMRRDAQAQAFEPILRDLINTPDGATYFADKIWGVNVRYDLGDSRQIVGRSTPDFELEEKLNVDKL